jgi:hypothetical protein
MRILCSNRSCTKTIELHNVIQNKIKSWKVLQYQLALEIASLSFLVGVARTDMVNDSDMFNSDFFFYALKIPSFYNEAHCSEISILTSPILHNPVELYGCIHARM